MEKTILILNPAASRGTAFKEKEKIENVLKENNIKSDIYISNSALDIVNATDKFIKQGYKNFIGAGGDGTIHYITQKLAGTQCNLGIISIGSGNDLIKSFGIKQG